jgi:hypothetical protein
MFTIGSTPTSQKKLIKGWQDHPSLTNSQKGKEYLNSYMYVYGDYNLKISLGGGQGFLVDPFIPWGDAILYTKSNDLLEVSIGSILRPKMKWIQKKVNRLSQEAWVKKIQIY